MNSSMLAHAGYQTVRRQTISEKEVELQVFSRITYSIENAMNDETGGGFIKLAEALNENRQLWSAIAVDVMSDDNMLPKDLRGKLFYLSKFMSVQTEKVLNKQSTAQSIIDINKSIIAGLQSAIDNKNKDS